MRSPDARSVDTDGIIHTLRRALGRRVDRRARQVLAHFGSSWLPRFPAVDRRRVAAFVGERFRAVAALGRRRDARVRHFGLYALGLSGRGEAVAPILHVLTHQRDFFDHDHAYLAAGALGEVALPHLRRSALHGSADERIEAVQCLGQSPCNTLALLGEVAGAGPPPGFYSALYNQHRPEALALALPGLAAGDPEIVIDALGAVSACVELGVEAGRRPAVPARTVAQAIQPLLDAPGIWRDENDPWVSIFGWALETLTLLRHPLGRRMALSTLERTTDEGRLADALGALRSFPATGPVRAAVRPFARAQEPAVRRAARAVLRRAAGRRPRHG